MGIFDKLRKQRSEKEFDLDIREKEKLDEQTPDVIKACKKVMPKVKAAVNRECNKDSDLKEIAKSIKYLTPNSENVVPIVTKDRDYFKWRILDLSMYDLFSNPRESLTDDNEINKVNKFNKLVTRVIKETLEKEGIKCTVENYGDWDDWSYVAEISPKNIIEESSNLFFNVDFI